VDVQRAEKGRIHLGGRSVPRAAGARHRRAGGSETFCDTVEVVAIELYVYWLHMFTSNTHFSIGVHVTIALAVNPGVPMTSAVLAESVGTNPAFLRQVIGSLRDAGLVETGLGQGGGSLLGRPAASITLLDVFRATTGEAQLCAHTCPPDSTCQVAQSVPHMLRDVSSRLDGVMAAELSKTTVADLAAQIEL
jgi:Rrf2 family protein